MGDESGLRVNSGATRSIATSSPEKKRNAQSNKRSDLGLGDNGPVSRTTIIVHDKAFTGDGLIFVFHPHDSTPRLSELPPIGLASRMTRLLPKLIACIKSFRGKASGEAQGPDLGVVRGFQSLGRSCPSRADRCRDDRLARRDRDYHLPTGHRCPVAAKHVVLEIGCRDNCHKSSVGNAYINFRVKNRGRLGARQQRNRSGKNPQRAERTGEDVNGHDQCKFAHDPTGAPVSWQGRTQLEKIHPGSFSRVPPKT